MSDAQVQQLIQGALKAVKSGDKDLARRAFLGAIKLDPANETAWLGLATVGQDQRERLTALKKLLEINPDNEKALEAVRRMGIAPERLLGESAPAPEPEPPAPIEDTPVVVDPFQASAEEPIADSFEAFAEEPIADPFQASAEVPITEPPMPDEEGFAPPVEQAAPISFPDIPMPTGADGVPIPDPQRLQQAAAQADRIAQEYLASIFEFEDIEWVKKNKRRAGERDIWRLRFQVLFTVLVIVFVIGGSAVLFVANNPETQKILFAPTHTTTFTPTVTPSSTPGITPTSSPIPEASYTPSPTINPFWDEGDDRNPPRATELYSPDEARVSPRIEEAIALIEQGELVAAYDILEEERLASDRGYPYPYYYQTIIHLMLDEPEDALGKLVEGEEQSALSRLQENYVPFYHLGYAQLRLYEAEVARDADQTNEMNTALREVEERLVSALEQDAFLLEGYLLLARRHMIAEDYEAALATLNEPLVDNEDLSDVFFTNTALRVAKARVYMAQEDYAQAEQEAFETLYFNPFAEEAYQIQVEAALARQEPGRANKHLEAYLFFFPDNATAFKLQGDTYDLEQKPDQAIESYERALALGEDDVAYLPILRARAELYLRRRLYDLALDDLNAYLRGTEDLEVQVLRMQAAYLNGDYSRALRDTEDLLDTDIVPNPELWLLEARIKIDRADPDDTEEYIAAQELIQQAINRGLDASLRPIADEYLAQTYFVQEDYDNALSEIQQALAESETGKRHYLHGQILEAQEDWVGARDAYEQVLMWGQIFPYPYAEDAKDRYEEMIDTLVAEAEAAEEEANS